MTAIRWSHDDRHLGPLTFSSGPFVQYGAMVASRDDDDHPAHARIHVWRWTFLFAVPRWLIRPHKQFVPYGGSGFWDVSRREYGAVVTDGELHVRYGPQTNDSRTNKARCFFLPWSDWRHVRHTIYDTEGNVFAQVEGLPWDQSRRLFEDCPTVQFVFDDFDGEEITATCMIEERQWKRGSGWFKWLSLFWPDMVNRDLDIRFSEETGPRKGSWKGGTVGHSIKMKHGEKPVDAFMRYCAENNMTFIGEVQP